MFISHAQPQALGSIIVPTPGTPVALDSALITAGIMVNNDTFPANKILIQAYGGAIGNPALSGSPNAGNVYIGSKSMVRATLAGVIKVLVPGEYWTITTNVATNKYYLDKLYVDADHANDGVYGNADQN
jgi:hypothetical protein